uniref:Glycosyltransferase family 39 protein n=1 Tax=Schlesneria paludicola TaxID=360056 RepID=A0A7C2P0L4_9PLAN
MDDQSDVWQSIRHHAWILLVAGLVFFTNLGSAALFDEDEPKNAVCGREMFLRGDWVVPTFNHELRTDKPILIYWIMLCSYRAFGVNEFAARFGSSALAVATSVFVYHLGRKLFDRDVGVWGSLILSTSLMYSAVGRAVTPDSMLICCVTGTFLAYVSAVAKRHGGQFGVRCEQPGSCETDGVLPVRSWREFVPAHWIEALPMGLGMGLAVLAKGPVGIVLPVGILGVFLLVLQQIEVRDSGSRSPADGSAATGRIGALLRLLTDVLSAVHPVRIWRAFWALRLPLVIAVAAAVALPWYVAVGWATGGDWLAGFLGGHNVGRFLQPMENHSGPFFYYVPVILLGTFPWSVFLPVAVWRLLTRVGVYRPRVSLEGKRPGRHAPALAAQLFLACWAGVWIAFFSCASTKLPNYVLPSYPALALMTAWFLCTWRKSSGSEWSVSFRNACRALATVGVVLLIGAPIALSIFLPSEIWLTTIGLPPLVGAIAAYGCSLRAERRRAIRALGVAAVCLAVLVVGVAPARVARHQDGPHFGRVIRQLFPEKDVTLATFDYFSPNLVFYAADQVHRLKRPPQIAEFLSAHPEGLVLTRADRWEQMSGELGEGVTILARQPRFLRRHDLVLLGRKIDLVQPVSDTIVR